MTIREIADDMISQYDNDQQYDNDLQYDNDHNMVMIYTTFNVYK